MTATIAAYQSETEALGKRASQFSADLTLEPKPIPGVIQALDAFAGAGGFSQGLVRSARERGYRVDLRLINHWSTALEAAKENLGDVQIFNASVQDLDPREVVPSGYLDIMLASPECIFFSSARGAKPINDQRRSTAAEILRFMESLWIETVVIENVTELTGWCRLDENMRPVKEHRGEYFRAFIKAMKRLGYNVEYREEIAANHGDATTRKRLFIVAQKRARVTFPKPTHSKGGIVPDTLPWVAARAIIDFTIKGLSIFGRATPHAIKTLRRISIGFSDQIDRAPLAQAYATAVERFKAVTEHYHREIEALPTKKQRGRNLTKPERDRSVEVKRAARQQHRLLVEEAFRTPVAVLNWDDILLRESVEPTLDGENRLLMGTLATAKPVVTKLFGTANVTDIDDPLDTIKAGGSTYGLARPIPESFMVTPNHGDENPNITRRAMPIDEPVQTITAKNPFGLVHPDVDDPNGIMPNAYLLRANASETSAWDDAITSVDTPLRTIVTKNNLSLVSPEIISTDNIMPDVTILPQHTYGRDTTASPDEPLPTITTISRHGIVQPTIDNVDPFVASYYGPKGDRDRAPRSVDEPLATQPTANRFSIVEGTITVDGNDIADIGVVQSLVNMKGQSTASSVDEPTPTITAHAPHLYLAEGFIASHHSNFRENENRNHSLDDPTPTTTTRGTGYLVQPEVDPVLVSQHYTYNENPDLDEPVVTATTRGAGYIAQPVSSTPDSIIIPQQRGAGVVYDSLERPLRTLTTRDGSAIATPIQLAAVTDYPEGIEPGKPYVIISGMALGLDILYRMLAPEELSRAHSFSTDEHTFSFGSTTSSSAKVKMIGNAVAVRTAKAVVGAALQHRYAADAQEVAAAA